MESDHSAMENKLDTVNSSLATLNASNAKSQKATEYSLNTLEAKLTAMGVDSSALKKTLDDFKASDASDDKKV